MLNVSEQSFTRLERDIQYVFVNRSLLKRALTHRSCQMQEHHHMERLEFLGDAVLDLVMAEYLHEYFPNEQEGQLSRMRSALVRKESLLQVGNGWHLSSMIQTGEGERHGAGVKSQSIIANAVEAIIGAVFLDAGWSTARNMVLQAWQPLLKQAKKLDIRDAKSALQEKTQALAQGLPQYDVKDLGVQASPRFIAQCRVLGKVMGEGMGERKKIAELAAASAALEALLQEEGDHND